MQVILCQNSFIPQNDNFGIGVQVSVLGYVCGEWIQIADSSHFGQCRCWNCLIQGTEVQLVRNTDFSCHQLTLRICNTYSVSCFVIWFQTMT